MARIPAQTQRQAMDWSLVLVSQGIESTLEFSEEKQSWCLQVPVGDMEGALKAIRLYRLENRRWSWRHHVFRPGIIFDWGSLGWAALLVLFYWADATIDLKDVGIVDSSAVARGQWWRLFTAVWLHADLAHLASNATIGVILLGLCMGRLGAGSGLLGATCSGVAANAVACLLSVETHRSLGASGVVMGCLGLLAAQSLWFLRKSAPKTRYVLSAITSGLMLFVLLGLTPGTDIVAHSAGFFIGLIFGGFLGAGLGAVKSPTASLISGALWTLLVVGPWWLALAKRAAIR